MSKQNGKSRNTWIILGIVIILAGLIYLVFYKPNNKSTNILKELFYANPVCYPATTNLPEFLKAQSGIYASNEFAFTCISLNDINTNYMDAVPIGMNKIHHTYNELLTETGLMDAFYDRTNLVVTPVDPTDKGVNVAAAEYLGYILTGLRALNTKLTALKALGSVNIPTGLEDFVNGALAKYGSITDLPAYMNTEMDKVIGAVSIRNANKSPAESFKDLLGRFVINTADIPSSACSIQSVAIALQGVNKTFALYDIMKLLYSIVKGTTGSAYPGLTFNKLKASPDYNTIKTYYLMPGNMFTTIKRNDIIYVPRTTTADNPNDTMISPKYPTDDDYMSAITNLINTEIGNNVAADGKLVKDYANLGSIQDVSDNIYNNLMLYKQQCLQLSSAANITNCYTDAIKANCVKINAILDNTNSILDALPTTTTAQAGGTTSTTAQAGGTTTTAQAGGTTTTTAQAGGTTTTTALAGGPTTTTIAGGPTTTTIAGGPTTTAQAGGTTTTALAGGPTTTALAGGPTTTAQAVGPTTTTIALAGTTTTAQAGGPTTTAPGTPLIFDRASQEEWRKFWDDIAVLFTGRIGDVGETANTLMSLTQDQRNSICSTYCNGIYAECTDICRLAKCSNCENQPAQDLTGAGSSGTDIGYSLWGNGLLDNTDDSTWAMNLPEAGKASGTSVYQEDGISNIFAPYISITPSTSGTNSGYSAFLMNNPNDPVYRAYIAQLMADYSNVQ